MTIQLFYSELYSSAISPVARFPRERYRLVKEAITVRNVTGWARLLSPLPASREEVLLAHEAGYVDAFINGQLCDKQMRRIGMRPWQPEFVLRTLTILGGSIAALHAAVQEDGVAGNLAGGTHHAYADRGEGYCVFNDLAVCVHIARRDHGLQRIAIVDCDVHQGNGTAAIFAGDPDVFTFSIHGEKNFPFKKEHSDLDVALENECSDQDYLAQLDKALPAVEDFKPDIIFYQAGCDPLQEDRLGKLALTREGLQKRNARVLELANRGGLPLVIFMGGGYAEPIDASVTCHADVFQQAAGIIKDCTLT